MSSQLYTTYKTKLLTAAANVDLVQTDTANSPYAVLIDTGTYTFSPTHSVFTDLVGIVGPPQGVQLLGGSVVNGVFDAADATFTAVTGPSIEAIVIYRHSSGPPNTWNLVAYYDGAGLPVVPNTADIVVRWNPAGIFAL